MSTLTREQIEQWRVVWREKYEDTRIVECREAFHQLNALCDAALVGLTQCAPIAAGPHGVATTHVELPSGLTESPAQELPAVTSASRTDEGACATGNGKPVAPRTPMRDSAQYPAAGDPCAETAAAKELREVVVALTAIAQRSQLSTDVYWLKRAATLLESRQEDEGYLGIAHDLESFRKDAERYRWLRIHGAALAGSWHQQKGLVRRVGNLDAEIDAAIAARKEVP